MWNGTGVSWMWALLSIVPLLLILGVGYLLYRGVRGSETNRPDPALEALRAAYARGDLTDEEFETRRERLTRE
nr:SHOCT domain-containing protein [Halorubrum vacuolatum]